MSTPTAGLDRHLSPTVKERKPTLSPTAISDFEVCGRRLQFYLDPDIPKGGTDMGLAKGRAWHWMMEQFARYRLAAQEGLVDTEDLADDWLDRLYAIGVGYFEQEINREDFQPREDDDRPGVHSQLWTMLTSWVTDPGQMWLAADGSITVETVEANVLTELGSDHHQLNGYIDAVYRITDGEDHHVVLVDYKAKGKAVGSNEYTIDDETGRLMGDPRKFIQAPLYAEGWERSTGEIVSWVVFDVMTKAGKFQRIWVDVRPSKRQPLIERWQQVSSTVHMYQEAGMDMPTNPGHYLCSEKWCSYWDICPMGAPYESEKRESNQ